jgi:hypothetical protein
MTKSATEVMQEILFSAVIDSIVALKGASKGLPNNLLRDLNAVHANTTYADLPPELQAAIGASVRAAFTRLMKEGYTVLDAKAAPPRPPQPRTPGGDNRGPARGRTGPGGPGRPAPRDGREPGRPPRSGPGRGGPGGGRGPGRGGPGGGGPGGGAGGGGGKPRS